MTEPDNIKLSMHEPAAFGQQLMLAREKANMTLAECATALHLSVETVEAIENSDLGRLPPVTFVQGYVRTYARLLGIPEETILKEFEDEVPHELETELHPRSPLPDQADSATPLVRMVSILLIVIAVVLLFYAVFSYYSEKTGLIEIATRTETNNIDMQLPPAAEQLARVADDKPVINEPAAVSVETQIPVAEPVKVEPEPAVAEVPATTVLPAEDIAAPEPVPMTGSDVIRLETEAETWAEIVDASDIRLLYGMLSPGRALELTGQIPFDVFLGNAPAVSLSVNGSDVDMTKFTRSNNIAHFKVRVEEGRIQLDKP